MTKYTALRTVYLRDPETGARVKIPKGAVIDGDDIDTEDEQVTALLGNPLAFGTDDVPDAGGVDDPSDDPLMRRSKDDLIIGATEWTAPIDVTGKVTKAELVAAIRAAGYDGDGSDLLDSD